MTGLRGITYLDGDVLATYPRDEVRGVALSRTFRPGPASQLTVDVAADPGRAWSLEIYAANRQLLKAIIESKESTRQWQPIRVDLAPFAGTEIHLRLIQRVLLGPQHAPGNAYWRNLRISTPPASRRSSILQTASELPPSDDESSEWPAPPAAPRFHDR